MSDKSSSIASGGGLAAFKLLVEGAVHDRFLDVTEESRLLALAPSYGLSDEEAEERLFAICRECDAVIERIAIAEFQERLLTALLDKFLDLGEHELLESMGAEIFRHASGREEMVARLIAEALNTEGALSERELRLEVQRKLEAGADQKRRVSRQSWDRIMNETTQDLKARGVSRRDSEVEEMFDDCRRKLGLIVSERNLLLTAVVVLLVALIVFATLFLLVPRP